MYVESHKDLIVWQKAMKLVVEIYKLTNLLPAEEKYGLVSQMRRAAVSLQSNIAEGKKRSYRKDYRNFILNALGSGAELETQLEISRMLGFVKDEDLNKINDLLLEVMKMLSVISQKLNEFN